MFFLPREFRQTGKVSNTPHESRPHNESSPVHVAASRYLETNNLIWLTKVPRDFSAFPCRWSKVPLFKKA